MPFLINYVATSMLRQVRNLSLSQQQVNTKTLENKGKTNNSSENVEERGLEHGLTKERQTTRNERISKYEEYRKEARKLIVTKVRRTKKQQKKIQRCFKY